MQRNSLLFKLIPVGALSFIVLMLSIFSPELVLGAVKSKNPQVLDRSTTTPYAKISVQDCSLEFNAESGMWGARIDYKTLNIRDGFMNVIPEGEGEYRFAYSIWGSASHYTDHYLKPSTSYTFKLYRRVNKTQVQLMDSYILRLPAPIRIGNTNIDTPATCGIYAQEAVPVSNNNNNGSYTAGAIISGLYAGTGNSIEIQGVNFPNSPCTVTLTYNGQTQTFSNITPSSATRIVITPSTRIPAGSTVLVSACNSGQYSGRINGNYIDTANTTPFINSIATGPGATQLTINGNNFPTGTNCSVTINGNTYSAIPNSSNQVVVTMNSALAGGSQVSITACGSPTYNGTIPGSSSSTSPSISGAVAGPSSGQVTISGSNFPALQSNCSGVLINGVTVPILSYSTNQIVVSSSLTAGSSVSILACGASYTGTLGGNQAQTSALINNFFGYDSVTQATSTNIYGGYQNTMLITGTFPTDCNQVSIGTTVLTPLSKKTVNGIVTEIAVSVDAIQGGTFTVVACGSPGKSVTILPPITAQGYISTTGTYLNPPVPTSPNNGTTRFLILYGHFKSNSGNTISIGNTVLNPGGSNNTRVVAQVCPAGYCQINIKADSWTFGTGSQPVTVSNSYGTNTINVVFQGVE